MTVEGSTDKPPPPLEQPSAPLPPPEKADQWLAPDLLQAQTGGWPGLTGGDLALPEVSPFGSLKFSFLGWLVNLGELQASCRSQPTDVAYGH